MRPRGSVNYVAKCLGISVSAATYHLNRHNKKAVDLFEKWLSEREEKELERIKAKSELLIKQKKIQKLMKG
jgi:hypothetical protein